MRLYTGFQFTRKYLGQGFGVHTASPLSRVQCFRVKGRGGNQCSVPTPSK